MKLWRQYERQSLPAILSDIDRLPYLRRASEIELSRQREHLETSPLSTELQVTRYSVGTDGVVMYHIDVQDAQDVLPTYTIRRRYTDFKNLYHGLAKIMVSDVHMIEIHKSIYSRFSQSGSTLPPLPSAGVWSYLRKHDTKELEKRREAFNAILQAAVTHSQARHSLPLKRFLSFAPESVHSRASYTSLRDYSIPLGDNHTREATYARRKLAQERRRSDGSETSAMIANYGGT